MRNIRLVTDSTADLTQEEIEQYQIAVVPLHLSIGEEEFIDGVTISKEQFLTKMRASSVLPKTAQPSLGNFIEVYDRIAQEPDVEYIISLHLMKSISGTVDAARQAAALSIGKVYVIDSQFTSRAMGMIVKEAARAIEAGNTIDQVLTLIEQTIRQTKLYLTVLELDNLIKGGRISRLMGAFSNLLNIKLFLEVSNGHISILQKGRGLKSLQSKYDQLFDEMQAVPQGIKEISIMHAGLNEFNQKNIDRLKTLFPETPLTIVYTSPVIMSHTGANAMAFAYLKNE